MKRLPPQYIFNDMSAGIMQNVRWNLVPQNSVAHAINVVFDEVIGEAVVRKGLTIKGSQVVDNVVNGLFYFKDTAGTAQKLIAVMNVQTDATQSIYYFDGANWQSAKTGDTANLKTRFEVFLDEVIRVNGTDTPVTSSNGITWGSSTALDTSNMPVGKYIRVYKDQVCIAGVANEPDALYISSVVNTGGSAISWTSGNRKIRFNPEDGGNITALGEVATLLIVFKDNGMFRWNNRSTDADQIFDVGCTSQESVVNIGGGLLSFFNDKGVWITTGEQPVLISRRVQKWIDGMSTSYYTSVASYGDGEHLYVSIGDCTVDGATYSNVVLRYSVLSKEWTVYTYPYKFNIFSRFLNGNEVQIVGGDNNGRIFQLESSSLTDNGTPIGFQIESHDLDFGSRGIVKELADRVMAYGINVASQIVQVKPGFGGWKTLGTMNNRIENFEIKETISDHFMRFRVVGASSTARFRFQGLEIPGMTLIDYDDETK